MQEIENIGEFNFAQTVEEKRIILEKLISDNQISEEDIKELKLSDSKGAVVKQIMEGSPASSSGIQVQDVVLKLNEKDVETPEDVISYVRESKIGRKIEMKISRKGQNIKLVITTAERPN